VGRITIRQKVWLPLVSILLILALLEGGAALLLKVGGDQSSSGVRFEVQEVWNHGGNSFHKPDPTLAWVAKPGFTGGEIRINQLGFRGGEVTSPKPEGVYRIVLLGNSVTFGYGVSEEATYGAVLSRDLNAQRTQFTDGTEKQIEVINAGVIGYTSWQGRLLLERSMAILEPDLIVVTFGYNDHHSAVESDAERYVNPHYHAVLNAFRQRSLYKYIHRLRGHQDPKLRTEPVARVSLSEFKDNLLAIQTQAAEVGADCLFISPALREGLPLVENFSAIDFADRRVWMRQIDFAIGCLGMEYKDQLLGHFIKSGSIDSFCEIDENFSNLIELTRQYPDLPIFHYLVAQCCRVKGVEEGIAPKLAEAGRLDQERTELTAYFDTMRELACTNQISLVDITNAFSQSVEDSLFLDVIHPTAKGHRLIADLLAERIVPVINRR